MSTWTWRLLAAIAVTLVAIGAVALFGINAWQGALPYHKTQANRALFLFFFAVVPSAIGAGSLWIWFIDTSKPELSWRDRKRLKDERSRLALQEEIAKLEREAGLR